MHFDDQNELFKNSAPNTVAISSTSGTYTAEGKFGSCIYSARFLTDIEDLGARDFTVDLWQKFNNRDSINYLGYSNMLFIRWDLYTNETIYYIIQNMAYRGRTPASDFLNDWFHFAACYDATDKILYTFVNGKLDLTVTNIDQFDSGFTLYPSFNQCYADELRVLDGVCQWTEDFTPPSEPY